MCVSMSVGHRVFPPIGAYPSGSDRVRVENAPLFPAPASPLVHVPIGPHMGLTHKLQGRQGAGGKGTSR